MKYLWANSLRRAVATTFLVVSGKNVVAGQADGKTPLAGDANWRVAAERRIEQHRKADFVITVTDTQGRPVQNASVTVTMKRHQFGFGALIGTSRWEDRPNPEDARRHLRLVEERFNKAVTILNPAEPSSNQALDWLSERGIRVRGHYLMWAPVQPERGRLGQPGNVIGTPLPEIEKLDDARRSAIRQAAFAHIDRLLAFAGPRVAEWDAINHIANDSHVRFSDIFGTQIYADVIRHARERAPHAQMWVNEGNVLTAGNRQEKYHAMIAELIALGTKPDGIGFMSHFREGEITPPAEIYRRLERFAALVPNLQLTELDIDTDDEQLQADTMRDVLTIAFSHPAVSGIVMWQIWGAGAGNKTLWRADWSIKPAGQVWLDLVFNQWWTEAKGVTDVNGRFSLRGFLGEYDISLKADGQSKTIRARIPRGGTASTIQL
jgi:endo-1,4-beta-xylanase